MPRRSKAELDHLNVVPLPQYQRPEPPADLEPDVAAVWTATTSSLRPDHFHAAVFPLLICYCRAVVMSARLHAERGCLSVEDRRFARLANLCNQQDRTVLSLARSLRLTPRSRRDPVDTRWQDRRKPWED